MKTNLPVVACVQKTRPSPEEIHLLAQLSDNLDILDLFARAPEYSA